MGYHEASLLPVSLPLLIPKYFLGLLLVQGLMVV